MAMLVLLERVHVKETREGGGWRLDDDTARRCFAALALGCGGVGGTEVKQGEVRVVWVCCGVLGVHCARAVVSHYYQRT